PGGRGLFLAFFLNRFAFLALEAGGSGDGGDGEVAVGDGRLHFLRQGDRRDVDGVAELGAGEIDLDGGGDRIGRNLRLDLVAHDVEQAAALDAGRLLLVEEVNRNLHRHQRVGADAQEVDMDREVADRIELVFLGQNLDLLAADVDRGDGGHEAAAVNLVVDVLVAQRDGERGLLVAVDDGGHLAVAAQFAGGPLTDPVA